MTPNQSRTIAAVSRWHRERPPIRPYRLQELMNVLQSDAATTGLALRLHGWTRDRVVRTWGGRRQLCTYWIPPNGKPVPRRRRGRPSFADLFNPS